VLLCQEGKREQILSQFANDASLFLAAKDDNVNSTAALLNHFLFISSVGLKTKAWDLELQAKLVKKS
jgi:hypothetical protein